jgi:hypothetical protein
MNLRPLALGALLVAAACGGNPPAAPTAPTASALPPPSAAPAASSSAVAAPEPPKPVEKPLDDALKPTRKPQEIVTMADALFLLAFGNSDVGKAAEKKCAASSNGDPKAEATCVAAASDKILVNAMRFKQDAAKNWWWTSMQKKGNNLSLMHKVMFDFGEETDRTIVIKPKGGDQGNAKWAKVPASVKIEVLNDYTIALDDPQFGKLLYEAKIGLEAK